MMLQRKSLIAVLAALSWFLPVCTPAQSANPPAPPADDSSGPAVDNGPIVIPKKKTPEEPPPPPAPEQPIVKNPPELNNFAIRVDTSLVNVDASVLIDKNKQFVDNLTAKNFVVYEDGVPQTIHDVKITQTPVTAVMLLEFAATSWPFVNDMRNSSDVFFEQLRPDDYIAVLTFDIRTHILTDFTSNKSTVQDALRTLTIPDFRETNLFDALYETLDRLTRVEGRKDIILIASGRDTMSRANLDQILAKVKATPNVTIYSIGTGQFARTMAEGQGRMGGIADIDYLQADNQMQTFAKMTGGQAFFPLFQGGLPDVFKQINQQMRSEYVITYKPTNTALDGSYRKLKVELVDDEGHPLVLMDERGRPLKYSIVARDGYTAKRQVE
jgi:VWFA-related protein